jgi:formylglycine-generating enzyme required for sulfatase activity
MNLTCQYIVNPKSRDAYINSESSYKSIRTTSTRLRMSDDRRVLNSRKKRVSFQVEEIGFDMLYCPRGKFMMGSNNEDDDNPQRPMAIERPFLLGETEVTQELFQAIMGYNPSVFQGDNYPNSKQRPVDQVTWYDAVMFCNKLSLRLGKRPYYNILNEKYEYDDDVDEYLPNIGSANVTVNPQANGFRLPFREEWEYAFRAGPNDVDLENIDVTELKQIAWFKDNSNDQTHPVKGMIPNEWGLYDMIGNVWEWCYDDDNYSSQPPTKNRIALGCSWSEDAEEICLTELDYPPNKYFSNIGFRISAYLVK